MPAVSNSSTVRRTFECIATVGIEQQRQVASAADSVGLPGQFDQVRRTRSGAPSTDINLIERKHADFEAEIL
jgi:hypothetical protein